MFTLIFVAGMALITTHSSVEFPGSTDRRIEELAAFTQEQVDTTWLTNEIRPVVIRRLLSEHANADRDKRCKIEMSLVTIGHLETIERLANQMKAGEECRALEFSAREEAIPMLMNVVETGPSFVPGFGDGDVFTPSVRIQAAGIVFEVIRSRNVFPEETKIWLSSLSPLNDSERGLENLTLLESWWKGNQAAIKAQKYSEASWLPPTGSQKGRNHPRSMETKAGIGRGDMPEGGLQDDGQTKKKDPNAVVENQYLINTILYGAALITFAFIIWLLLKGKKGRP